MRIALFSETYIPSINGVVSHVTVLKEGLEQLGHEVLIVTTDPDTNRHYVKNRVLYCPGKKIKKLYDYGVATPIHNKRYKYLRDFNPDVIHIHTEFSMGLFGLITAQMLKKPIIYTMHTMYDDYLYYFIPKGLEKVGASVFHKYIRTIANKADMIIGVSIKSGQFLKSIGVKKKLEIIQNAVDVHRFSCENVSANVIKQLKEKYKLPQDSFIGCFISRIAKEKSIDVLIKYSANYMRDNDKFYLMIVGDGPEKKDLEQLAQSLGVADKVIFTGKILNKDILPYYGLSDFYITASLSEANSISMLEAMSMGLPVLERHDEANKDQIINGVNGYSFVDKSGLYRLLDNLYNMNEIEMSELKENVRNSMVDRGALDIANRVLEVYYKAIRLKKEKIKLKEAKSVNLGDK